MSNRPVFIVHLRAELDVDGELALRRFLKLALRQFGLRAVRIEKQPDPPSDSGRA